MESATGKPNTGHVYNARGQRVIKTTGNRATVYHHDEGGRLLAETDERGEVLAEYVYLNDQPLARIAYRRKGKQLLFDTHYYHLDHLGTPQALSGAQRQIVWQGDYEPFGNVTVKNDAATQPLRFPGQYADGESGLHDNWFRSYDPDIGRYLQSDPIGLAGGLNTYAYTSNNPINYIDPEGLAEYYGNWCGPDWTGGYEKQYDELTEAERKKVLAPKDALDKCCESHDKKYADCRNQFPCDEDTRKSCFMKADRELSKCAANCGVGGSRRWGIEVYMGRSKPGAGPNNSQCRAGRR